MYEAYGQGGTAILIECLTDNKNRAAADVRTAVTRNGGNMADPGSVSFNFERKGVIVVSGDGTTEDDVMMVALEAGAEEVEPHPDGFEIITDASEMVAVRQALQAAEIDYESADAEFVPHVKVPLDADTARKLFKLIDGLEDLDDVQNVFTNLDLTPEVQAELNDNDEE